MSEQSGYPGAPPGWYPDPAGGPGQRWWDGYAWSEAVVMPQQPPPPPWATTQGPPLESAPAPWVHASPRLNAFTAAALVARELAVAPGARITLMAPGITGLLQLLVMRTQSSQLLRFGHEMRITYDDASRGITPPTFTNTSFSPWFVLLGIVSLAALAVTLIWQHRAASAARAFGFPVTHSPAWGVGSWFVPIVNFWFPYQAVRDCLPPGDPNRSRVLQWWLALVLAGPFTAAAFVAAFFSSGVAVGLTIPAALLDVAVLAFAPHVVTVIAARHRAALEAQPGDANAAGGT